MGAHSLLEYQYEPLCVPDAVRILVLKLAQDFLDPLRGEIIQYSRSEFLCNPDNSAHYAAVSYTWGEDDFSEYILTRNDTSILKITHNVESLLRHLRKSFVPRYLWLDAICLNQSDTIEKSQQIPLMGEIYEQAKKVRIWLGEADDDTAKVFAFLRNVALMEEDRSNLLNDVLELLQKLFGHTSVAEIENFLCKPWFSRRWILQEAILAQHATVHCGNSAMPWSWLESAFSILQRAVEQENESFQLVEEAVNALKIVSLISDTGERALLDTIWQCHTSRCKEPQDRILSLYGLLSREGRRIVPLDYGSQWTNIFREFAFTNVQIGNGVAIMSHLLAFGPINGHGSSTPSWIPDWSSHRQHINFLLGQEENPFLRFDQNHRTVVDYRAHLRIPDSNNSSGQVLELTFVRMGQVQHPIVKLGPDSSWRDATQSLSHLFSLSPISSDGGSKRLALLISEMLNLNMNNKLREDYIFKYVPKAEQEKFSGYDYDVEMDIVFHHLLEIWEGLFIENHSWSSAQIYLLNAVGRLLQNYSLFYLPPPIDTFVFGPKWLMEGDLIVPLSQEGDGGFQRDGDLVSFGSFDFDRRAIALRLDDVDDFKENRFTTINPKARVSGACFCCFGRDWKYRKRSSIYLI